MNNHITSTAVAVTETETLSAQEVALVSSNVPVEKQEAVALFRYSGLVDQLRDTAMEFYKAGNVSSQTMESMICQYMELRAYVAKSLLSKCGLETLQWAPPVDGPVAIDTLYQACCQLSRWADLVHQTPNFLIAQDMIAAQTEKMLSESVQETVSKKPIGYRSNSEHSGQYL